MLDQHRRVDTAALKRSHPIADVVSGYGVELHPAGRALVGRCPLHNDSGRPNLHVYADTDSWYCYRCGVGGDAIRFVECVERTDFLAAVARLGGGAAARPDGAAPTQRRGSSVQPLPAREHRPPPDRPSAAARACLAAAVELYANRLLTDGAALAYVEGRGVDRGTAERCRLGFAAGDELVEYLRWRRLPLAGAQEAGVLTRDGREFFAGRVVVPEVRGGRPIWAIGRAVGEDGSGPRYLGLRGHKPLLGLEHALRCRTVCLVEGVFDWLVLRAWDVPAVALVGTQASAAMLAELDRFARLYLVLDGDDAGRAATAELAAVLGERAIPVALPRLPGVKDVADLARHPDGRALFGAAVTTAARTERLAVGAPPGASTGTPRAA